MAILQLAFPSGCNVLRRLRWQLTRLVAGLPPAVPLLSIHAATAADNSTLAAAEKAEG